MTRAFLSILHLDFKAAYEYNSKVIIVFPLTIGIYIYIVGINIFLKRRNLKMSEKGKAILAYIFGWLGGLIVLFGMKDNERNTKFHAAQAIVLSVGYFLITLVYRYIPITIPFFSTALWAIYIIGIIMGIVKANKEEDPELPLIGGITKSIFSKQIEE